ncbi:nucleoside deaminase [Microbacterium sp. 22296]|uniref:nucleoside deaminase n=1 Tax=Microbacterium sp. 22296 TaxID=3453903 RepID=UPI003F86FE75
MNDHELTALTLSRASENVRNGGKPFACLIVKDGEIVAEAVNHVSQEGDPTAHAEVRAIRAAAAKGISDLGGYDMFVTAYPCPMCLGAVYYAQPDRLVYAATREQEGEHYEDGNRLMTLATFYDEYAKPVAERSLPTEQGRADDPTAPFREWTAMHGD